MKLSELKGMAVVNLEDARKLGTVEDLMVDAESHHIVSIKVRTGMFHAPQIIPVADVKNVGSDAVTISIGGMENINSMTGAAVADAAGGAAQQQMAASDVSSNSAEGSTTTSTITSPISTSPVAAAVSPASVSSKAPIEVSSLLGNKVVTDAGTMLGNLSDVIVDWVDLTITGYEVHMGGMFTKAQEFVDTPGVRYGDKLITLPAELVNQPK